jgi:hypothetical protein
MEEIELKERGRHARGAKKNKERRKKTPRCAKPNALQLTSRWMTNQPANCSGLAAAQQAEMSASRT